MITDSHCHLEVETYGEGLDATIAAARQAGISRMVTIGSGRDVLKSGRQAVALAKRYDFIWPTVGVHPHDAGHMTEAAWKELGTLANDPRVCGIGETGLDYFYEHSPKEAQKEAFSRSIAMAAQRHLALVVHVRDAHDDCIALLKEAQPVSTPGGGPGVIHCFTGGPDEASKYLDMGFFISFSGIVTFKKTDAIRAAAKRVPLDRILVETDAPYLAPMPHRGKRNEPALLIHTVRLLAELRQESYEALAHASSDNASRLFQLSAHALAPAT